MIRRPHQSQWILISQVEHAHLAAALAKHWGRVPFAPIEPRDEVLAAIGHHDDGWAEWERSPGIDPENGRPLAFTEMPLGESLAIWRGSIRAAEAIGELAAYVVAGHFCGLLRRFNSWQTMHAPSGRQAEEFLAEFDRLMPQWLAAWKARDPEHNTTERAARALTQLQFFDALSLWFCCAERTAPEEMQTPDGPALVLTPETTTNGQRIQISPWPMSVERLELCVTGHCVPALNHATAADLWAAAKPVVVDWTVVP